MQNELSGIEKGLMVVCSFNSSLKWRGNIGFFGGPGQRIDGLDSERHDTEGSVSACLPLQ